MITLENSRYVLRVNGCRIGDFGSWDEAYDLYVELITYPLAA